MRVIEESENEDDSQGSPKGGVEMEDDSGSEEHAPRTFSVEELKKQHEKEQY